MNDLIANPNFMLGVLVVACFFLGVIGGYLKWAHYSVRADEVEFENKQINSELRHLRIQLNDLKKQVK